MDREATIRRAIGMSPAGLEFGMAWQMEARNAVLADTRRLERRFRLLPLFCTAQYPLSFVFRRFGEEHNGLILRGRAGLGARRSFALD